MQDTISINKLKICSHIGVPEAERKDQQVLCVSVEMHPLTSFSKTEDMIEKTVDYYQVCQKIKTLAEEKPRKLIETLAEDIAQMILCNFTVQAVSIELEKYILPDTEGISVKIYRESIEFPPIKSLSN